MTTMPARPAGTRSSRGGSRPAAWALRAGCASMRSLTTAAWGLRTYWRSAIVLVVTIAAALAVSLTVSSWILPDYPVLAPRFALPILPSWDTGIPWSAKAGFPPVLQWTAMVSLFRSLLGQTSIVCLIATVTVLGVSFARASARADEVAIC